MPENSEQIADFLEAKRPSHDVAVEPKVDDKGQRLIWLKPSVVNRLRYLRGPGEGYFDGILRLAEAGR